MVVFASAIALVLCAASSLASPTASPKVVHEKRHSAHSSWTRHRTLHDDHVIPVRVGLKQNNLDQVADLLYAVSDPESPNYGEHWTMPKIANHFAPSKETIEEVMAWLEAEGFGSERVKVSGSKGWVEFQATAKEAGELLDTEFHMYKHPEGHEHIGCEQYSVPAHVKHHVDLITPTVNFFKKGGVSSEQFRKRRVDKALTHGGPKTNGITVGANNLPTDLANCDQFITPDCLRALYNIIPTPHAAKNTFAIAEFTPQSYVQSDLDMFFANFSKNQVIRTPKLVSIDGGVPNATIKQNFNVNGESNLDFEYAMVLTNPQEIQLYQAGDFVQGASFNNYLDAIDASFCTFEGGDDPNFDGIYPDPLPGGFKGPESCGIVPPANVISVSYGGQEIEVTPAYYERECAEYAKLGMAGVSILYSSGDNGVAGFSQLCINSTGQEDAAGTIFNPGFPVTCPFVTAVGATQVDPGKTVKDPEGACEQVIFSGGGFSNVFALPKYQETAVKSFFKNHPPPYSAAVFNNSQATRGYPDISANGANYVIAIDGEFELVFGTSASSPVVASMLTLINNARLLANKKPIGFINPAIYSPFFAGAFHDITHGGNQGCGTPGFTAVPGWDPVTGVGTPNFPLLLSRFLLLP